MTQTEVLIIGSGISALTSGLLLAQKGKKVILLEQYVKPGGYMHSFERFGETFDTGAHYVGAMGPGQPFRTLLEYLNVYEDDLFSPLNPEAFDLLSFPSGKIAIPQGYANVISEWCAVFPQDKDAVRKYFAMVERVCVHFPTYNYNDASDNTFPPEALELSLKSVVEGLTSNRRLQAAIYAYCNLHGVFPEDVAFGFHAIVTDSLIRGPYGLEGGGDRLTQKFISEIEKLGGKVLTRHQVAKLEVNGRQVSKVTCANGAEFSADWIISTIHPKATFRLLSDQTMFPPVFKDRIKNIKESVGIFGMYAVCKEKPPTDPATNYYFFRSDDPADMFAGTNPGEAPPVIFMSSPKRKWAPDEKNFPMSLHIAGPYEWFTPWEKERWGRRPAAYKDLKTKISESIWTEVAKHEPDLPAKIAQSQTSSVLTHLHFNGSEEGSSYGLYHSIQNTGARALGPRTKVLNLLLAGQSCLFPGLLGAATSALRTCGHIVGIKPILQELKAMGARAHE